MPVAEAIALAAAGEMTVDAALVTLDFALRHRLLPAGPSTPAGLAAPLWLARPAAGVNPAMRQRDFCVQSN